MCLLTENNDNPIITQPHIVFRDGPFNLKGGYGFWFHSEVFFRTTQELEYFFLSRKAQNFVPEFNIRLYDKNSQSDYFLFLHQKQNFFFSIIGNQNIFLEKKHNPSPFKLNGRSLSVNIEIDLEAITIDLNTLRVNRVLALNPDKNIRQR